VKTWNVFALARMRDVDLLALYFELNPGIPDTSPGAYAIGRASKGALIDAILASPV
jgi:hypothetical protein